MTVLRKLLGTAFVLLFAMGAASAQQRSDITLRMASFAGPFGEALQKYAIDLFTRNTGIKVEVSYANPADFLAQMIASRGRRAPYDVVCLDDDVTAEAIRAGVVQKLDPAIVTNLKNLYPQALNKDGYGPALFFFSFGIAFNKDKLKRRVSRSRPRGTTCGILVLPVMFPSPISSTSRVVTSSYRSRNSTAAMS